MFTPSVLHRQLENQGMGNGTGMRNGNGNLRKNNFDLWHRGLEVRSTRTYGSLVPRPRPAFRRLQYQFLTDSDVQFTRVSLRMSTLRMSTPETSTPKKGPKCQLFKFYSGIYRYIIIQVHVLLILLIRSTLCSSCL